MATTVNLEEELYISVMNNVSICGTKKNAYINTILLTIDPEYQRIETRNKNKVSRLVREWDDNQMDPLRVVPHPEEYKFSVVDGLGRLTAAKQKGITSLNCVIIDGPADPEERRIFEARLFLHQNDCLETVKPVQMHKARVLDNDQIAIAVEDLCKQNRVEIVEVSGQRHARVLGSYSATYGIAKEKGVDVLKDTFRVLDKAGYMEEGNGLSSRIMVPVANIIQAYPDVIDLIGGFMRKTSPNLLIAKGAATYPERGWRASLTLYLQDYIVEETGYTVKFDSKGKRIKVA